MDLFWRSQIYRDHSFSFHHSLIVHHRIFAAVAILGCFPVTTATTTHETAYQVQKTVFPSPTGAKTSYDREHHRSQSPALRRCDRTPRDSQPSAQRAESSRNTAANNKKEITVTLVGELVVLSHQTIASVVHATLRAAVDSWTGLASAARKALRKWKVRPQKKTSERVNMMIIITNTDFTGVKLSSWKCILLW